MGAVTLTGTGVPIPHPLRAGGGVLVQTGGRSLQFDAGRATSMRLAALDVTAAMLDAVFLTHHHSDHLQGLDDLVFTRLTGRRVGSEQGTDGGLPVIAPDGALRTFLQRFLDPWEDDLETRRITTGVDVGPPLNATFFGVSREPVVVWSRGDVRVLASAVQHEPVVPAVGYRVESPDGVVAISGDTRACPEMEALARDADVLVHEVMLSEELIGTPRESVMHYHTDAEALGQLARSAGAKTLMLTHFIPAPDQIERGEERYADAVRRGGFEGELIVGTDLSSVSLGAGS
jgi:ribonuclease Z